MSPMCEDLCGCLRISSATRVKQPVSLLGTMCFQDATWNGFKMNAEAAADVFGADDVYPLSEVRPRLRPCVTPNYAICSDTDQSPALCLSADITFGTHNALKHEN